MIRILIVDDQNILRQGIQALLESNSEIEVVGVAANGKDAIEQTEILKPDAILMDIEMPHINGINATHEICQRFPFIKVLILSSHENSEYIVQALQVGADGYLLKSALANELEQAILSVCQGQLQIQSKLFRELLNDDSFIQSITFKEKQNEFVLTRKQSTNKVSSRLNNFAQKRSDNNEQYLVETKDYIRKQAPRNINSKNYKSPKIDKEILNITPEKSESETQKISDKTVNEQSVKDLGKKRNSLQILRILLSLCLVIVGARYVYHQFTINAQKQKAARIKTVSVQRADVPIRIETNGTIFPEKQINISPKTVSVVKSLSVKEGESVTKGQVLAYMEDLNLQGELIAAKGELAGAEARLRELQNGNRLEDIAEVEAQLNANQATLRQAELTFSQNQKVYEAGGISLRDFEESRSAFDSAQARVAEAQQVLAKTKTGARPEEINQVQAQVTVAKGQLQSIHTQIQDLVIRTPFDGIVSRKFAEPGSLVSPTTAGSAEASATSSSILSLTSANQIVAKVSENDISKIRLGQKVLFEADAYLKKNFTGQVAQIAVESTVEENVTSFEVKIAILDDFEQALLSGMNVSVKFQAGQQKDVLVVPNTAIVRRLDAVGVFVLGKNSNPIFIPIETGITASEKTVVQSGLKGTEKILISSPASLKPASLKPDSNIPSFFKGIFPRKRH